MFDYVIGAWGGDLERILTIGGDNEASGGKQNRQPFQTRGEIPRSLPPEQESNTKQSFTFPLHRFRTGHGDRCTQRKLRRYGKSRGGEKPLMMLATMPRVLGPRRNHQTAGNGFAMENFVKKVNISCRQIPSWK